mmetsp:Transcript_5830/g.19847  ORF Transcript_5830/g.19847 Transcript_5830/m.19847 type:complete len:378 (-) Transcript_5830:1866-2999(-)
MRASGAASPSGSRTHPSSSGGSRAGTPRRMAITGITGGSTTRAGEGRSMGHPSRLGTLWARGSTLQRGRCSSHGTVRISASRFETCSCRCCRRLGFTAGTRLCAPTLATDPSRSTSTACASASATRKRRRSRRATLRRRLSSSSCARTSCTTGTGLRSTRSTPRAGGWPAVRRTTRPRRQRSGYGLGCDRCCTRGKRRTSSNTCPRSGRTCSGSSGARFGSSSRAKSSSSASNDRSPRLRSSLRGRSSRASAIPDETLSCARWWRWWLTRNRSGTAGLRCAVCSAALSRTSSRTSSTKRCCSAVAATPPPRRSAVARLRSSASCDSSPPPSTKRACSTAGKASPCTSDPSSRMEETSPFCERDKAIKKQGLNRFNAF